MPLLLHTNSMWEIYFWIVFMGLGYSGIYASIVSYGTSQLKTVSSRLMTFFVTIGASGGILSFVLASLCKQYFNVKMSLLVSAVLMGLVTVAIGLTVIGKRMKGQVGYRRNA